MKTKMLIALGLLIFFISTLSLSIGLSGQFNSPDERANFLFAKQFASEQTLFFSEPLNLVVSEIVHPRSMIAVGSRIVPGSFLGLPLISGIFGAINESLIYLVTPLLAIIGLLAWRRIVLYFSNNKTIANLSLFFVAIHPAFWYYTTRTMMHNIGFVSLLLAGCAFFFTKPIHQLQEKYGVLDSILGGLLIGLALSFRTSELLWVAIGLFIGTIFGFRSQLLSIKDILLAALFAALTLAPFAWLNQILYGGALQTGYTAGGSAEVVSVQPPGIFERVFDLLFPFGIHEMNILDNIWQYGFLLYPWMSALALLGIGLILLQYKKMSTAWKSWTIFVFVLSVWLFVVYGSWNFNDNPDPLALSIGNSYARYWLPIFIAISPFAAKATLWLSDVNVKRVKPILLSIILIGSTALSAYIVFLSNDGIVPTRRSLDSFQQKREFLMQNTPEDAVIIADMADKYIFPERAVIAGLRSDATYASIDDLLNYTPVYYFGITLPDKDIDYLNTTVLGVDRVYIEKKQTIDDETLYEFGIR